MSIHIPHRSRVVWLVGLLFLVVGALGLFGFLRGRVGQRLEVPTPLEQQVRRANAQARLVSLKTEVLAEQPTEVLRQQYQVIVDQLDGLEVGSENPSAPWDALTVELAELDVQLADKDRETLATIDALLTLLNETRLNETDLNETGLNETGGAGSDP